MDKNKEVIRAIKFTLFSISAGIVQVVSFALFNELMHLNYWFSYLVALILSVVWNFTFNRKFTFKSAANVPIAMLKVFFFYLIFTPVSTIIGNYFSNLAVNYYLILAVSMISNFVLEFLYDKYIVFKNNIDNA